MTQYQVTVDEATVQQVLQRDDELAQLVSMVLDQVLVLQVGESEFEQSWRTLFTWLKERGLQGVDLVVPVDHGGLVSAIAAQL